MTKRKHNNESKPKGRLEVKGQRKRTAAERQTRRERREKYMTVFMNGKQKRVLRPHLIEGLTVDEFVARNADPIWLHQNEMWELMTPDNNDSQVSGVRDIGDDDVTACLAESDPPGRLG